MRLSNLNTHKLITSDRVPVVHPVQLQQHSRKRSYQTCRAGEQGLSYKDAGVDIDAGNELVRRIQKLNPSIGGFSGMVPFGTLFV